MRLLIDLEPLQRGSILSPAGSLLPHFLQALLETAPQKGVTLHLLANTAHAQTIAPLQREFADLQTAGRLHLFEAPDAAGGPACKTLLKAFSIAGLCPDLVLVPTLTKADATAAKALAKAALMPCPLQAMNIGENIDLYSFFNDLERHGLRPAPPAHTAFQPFGKPSPAQQQARTAVYRHLGLFKPYVLCVLEGPNPDLTEVEDVLRAHAALSPPATTRVDLVLAGSFTVADHDALHGAAQAQGLEPEHLHLLSAPTWQNTQRLIAGARLVLDLGPTERLNGIALQAVATHVPVVAPDMALNRDLLGTDLGLFAPQDPQNLNALLNGLLTHPKALNTLREAQIDHARTVDWPQTAQNLLESLAKATPAPQEQKPLDWPALQERLNSLEAATTEALRTALAEATSDRVAAAHLARAVVGTRCEIENAHRGPGFGPPAPARTWRIEGPFDSSYSLASINRGTARGLVEMGWPVALFSAEGPGPYDPDEDYLKAHPDLAPLRARAEILPPEAADITSRDMFPPRCDDMVSRFNLIHSYGWEETGFPAAYTRDINRHLQGVTTLAPHVVTVMRNAGISVPIISVGGGLEQIDVPPEPLPFDVPTDKYLMLHVSSCFPRKGVDVMLEAFAEAFSGDTKAARDTCLLIKTHENPHNTIEAEVAALRAAHPVLPDIIIETADLTSGQLRGLYEAADLLLAPSRAEGLCLPIAEAVLVGTPVLATGWSGQMVFKPNPMITFIDYDFAEAGSHLDTVDSVWAEPRMDDLARHMKAARKGPPPSAETAREAARVMRARHSWSEVARNTTRAAHEIVHAIPKVPPRIGWVSTFGTRCGIATYSAHLLSGLPDRPTILANITEDIQTPDTGHVIRCWTSDTHDTLDRLHDTIIAQDLRTIVLQINYGFYNFNTLGRLIRRLKTQGCKIVLMLHATNDAPYPPERQLQTIHMELALCDRLLVHSVHDLNRLKALGLVDNVALFPHGVLEVPQVSAPDLRVDAPFVIGTYGFLLPPKGFPELIEALGLMRDVGRDVQLRMINAEFPVPESAALVAQVKDQIAARGLTDHVTLCTDFLSDEESFQRLSEAHLLVFPYRPTTESASGAVRQALALSRPVAVTPQPIFDDVQRLTLPLPGFSAQDIATGLSTIMDEMLAGDPDGAVAQSLARGADWRQALGYSQLSARLWAILQNL